jgi:SIR2-like domain
MSMNPALRVFFEGQVQFRLIDGTEVEGGVYVGSTEFLPVETLSQDADAYRAEFDSWLNEVWIPEQQETRNKILALHANEKRYVDLCAAAGRQQVVPVVGSGMSVASGLPTWTGLLRRVREFTTCDPNELELLIDNCEFEEAADLLASGTNPRLLAERVEHDLRIDDPNKIAGPVRLLPTLFPRLVVTTNLDNVLELTYGSCERWFKHVLAGGELAQYRALKSPSVGFLLKLHGDCTRATTRVLLSSEYEATYAAGKTIREELTLLYRFHSLLFLGCSLGSDRTMRLIEEVAASDGNMPKHYCFLPLPADEAARIGRENFLSQRGIYPIWYDLSHDESLTALLDGLRAAASEGT